MRKIRLSDTDIEFFDMEVSPTEFLFFTKHKDAFRCMWKEQGKPFWTRFIITFRSYTVKQGVIKQMSFDSPKLNDLLDQGFINIHEQFLDGNATTARSFIDDIARLAQNHDKFPNLDSKNFAKDPFYCRDTRELFRQFFGSPDQKSSYLKVYILSPVYLRFGGSVCRCLKRWMDAQPIDINDDSYWTPPAPELEIKKKESNVIMCSHCLDECGTLYFQEKLCGKSDGPKFIESWTKGDPRFTDKKNPLYNKIADPESDWRSSLTVEDFRDFVFYSNNTYGDKCSDCLSLTNNCPVHNCSTNNTENGEKKKRKRKKKKKAKEKENDTVKNEEEIEKLVNHIEGTAPLEVMPENTVGGSKSPTKETPPETEDKTDDMKSAAKREIFTKKAKISDDFKYGIMPYQDKSGADLKRSVIGGFKVKKIEDERTGACEITVTITTIQGETAKDRTPKLPGLEKNDDPRKINRFPLTADLLKTKMVELPKKMEWYEGWNWCASVMNFEEEEKGLCAKPTNFTIKVTGREEECVKRTMFKLLFYVIQRKSRPCPGWNMEDDDIVACILPDESTEFEGITICIIRGFRFEERLTDEEKSTMQAPPEECIANPKKVMMTWQPSKARSILRASPAKGRAELKELLLNVGSIVNRVDEIPEDCSPQKRKQLELKIQKQMTVLKARPPRKIDEGPMYKQMKQNPDTFELFIMSDADKVAELESIGMMAVDVDIDENSAGNFCENCGLDSDLCKCMDSTGKKQLPQCNCVNCLKEICVGALAGDFDHILAKDGIVKENGQYVTKSPEEIEKDIQIERRKVQRVLSDAEKRIAIRQATDKADGRITKKLPQSMSQPKVIKIDRNASVEKTIEDLKLQTAIYKQDLKRTEKSSKKSNGEVFHSVTGRKRQYSDRTSPEKSEQDSDLEFELRHQRIKELEIERSALRKMVLEEKQKEDDETKKGKESKRKEIEPKVEKKSIVDKKKSKEKKVTEGDKETKKSDKPGKKPVIEIELPINRDAPFKLDEKFVNENPHLLKQIVDALETNEKFRAWNEQTDDEKAGSQPAAVKIENKVFKPPPKKIEEETCKHVCPNCHNDNLVEISNFSVLKETEKSFNIIKKIGKKHSEIVKQLMEESALEEISFEECEEYNGKKADIILTGEPQCPCQAKAKELMKEKLKKRQKQKEPMTTLRKELSHRMNCPEQLQVREEKPSITASRPSSLANDPTIDISEIIEEQLIDTFNIKRIVKLGMKISQNATTQTLPDVEGSKPYGFKEKVVTSKPWTEERSNCVEEKDPDFERYLKYIDYKQDPKINIGIQAEDENIDGKADKKEKQENDGDTETERQKRMGSPENDDTLSKLRKCANCEAPEPAPKTYMKCQKCKLEGITNARYYCGRECQVKDWGRRHKKEHKEKLIQ